MIYHFACKKERKAGHTVYIELFLASHHDTIPGHQSDDYYYITVCLISSISVMGVDVSGMGVDVSGRGVDVKMVMKSKYIQVTYT